MLRYIFDIIKEICHLLHSNKPDRMQIIGLLLKEIWYTLIGKMYMYRYELAQWLVILSLLAFIIKCGEPLRGTQNNGLERDFYNDTITV